MRRVGLAALLATMVCAVPSWTDVAQARVSNAPINTPLSIDIQAQLVERCGLSAGTNPTSADGRLDRAETLTFNFDIDCNTPFRIGVSSANGALRLAGTQGVVGDTDAQGFAVEKQYRVGLQLETDAGVLDGGTCRSQELTTEERTCAFYGASSGHGLSSGQATAIDRTGTLTVRWQGQGDPGPRAAAGHYQDTLTVVVGPRT